MLRWAKLLKGDAPFSTRGLVTRPWAGLPASIYLKQICGVPELRDGIYSFLVRVQIRDILQHDSRFKLQPKKWHF